MSAFKTFWQSIFLYGTRVPVKAEWCENLKLYAPVQRDTIYRNGKRISVCRLPQKSKNTKVVILAHPISRKGKYFFTEGSRLQLYLAMGFDIVLFDFNGFGESDRIDMFYWKDVASVIRYVFNQSYDIVALHGISFGAFHMIRALAEKPGIDAVVVENVNRSLADYWKRWPVKHLIVRLVDFIGFPEIRDMNVIKSVASPTFCDYSVLFLACDRDEFTPADEMRQLYAVTRCRRKVFELLKNCKHLEGPSCDPLKYMKAVISFYSEIKAQDTSHA